MNNRRILRKLEGKRKVLTPYIPPQCMQIKACNEEIKRRMDGFIERKRNETNANNIREFCPSIFSFGIGDNEFSCARVDAVLHKRKGSKGHLQVSKVLNTYQRDQETSDYLTKYLPKDGVNERLENLEIQLSLTKSTPKNIYKRLKNLEDRVLHLESLSPEYINFWDKINAPNKPKKKRKYTVADVDAMIAILDEKNKDRLKM